MAVIGPLRGVRFPGDAEPRWMPVSWEALTAVASLLSSLAVLAAVLIAVRQVRVGAAQVDHLRRATQLDGTMKVFALLTTPEQREARRFIVEDLADRCRDDAVYRDELFNLHGDMREHRELAVMSLLEMIGIYVKHGLLDPKIVFDYWIPSNNSAWSITESLGVIAANRRVDPAMWENFEYLVNLYERSKAEGRPAPARPDRRNEVVADAPSV
jgi:hypothetical protein